jgi:hypothetical protein
MRIAAEQGGHLRATGITAYQDEEREESLKAEFDVHLNKFAQPNEWVETIAKLALTSISLKQDW